MRLTTNRAYKVSQIFGKLSDHCVPDGAFKRLLKSIQHYQRVLSSGSGPGPVNEIKLIALNCSSFERKKEGRKKRKKSRTSKKYVLFFSVLKSHITKATFFAYLNILLATCSLQ